MCNDNPIYTQKERGYVLISTLIALAVISLLGAASLSWAASSLKLSSRAVATEQAFYLANAGVEEASARARAGDLPARLERTVEIAPGITGQYAVDITEEPGNLYRVVSTGTAGAGRQTITATIRGVGQGTHVAYQSLMYTGGSLVVENQMDICGDIVVTGNAEFRAQATVWNQTKGQNKKSPCDSIMGTGKAEVGGLIDLQNSQTIIQGGYCSATEFGGSSPCDYPPDVEPMPPVDFTAYRSKADIVYLPSCTGETEALCMTTTNGQFVLTDTQNYTGQVIYVDGDIMVPDAGVTLGGNATFVATGQIHFEGDVLAPEGCTDCISAFISQGTQWVGFQRDVRGVFVVTGPDSVFGWDQHVTIRGPIIAPTIEARHHATIYPGVATVEITTVITDLPGTEDDAGAIESWHR